MPDPLRVVRVDAVDRVLGAVRPGPPDARAPHRGARVWGAETVAETAVSELHTRSSTRHRAFNTRERNEGL